MDDDAKTSLGQALIDAVQKGDGMAVYDAAEALNAACGSKGDVEEESDEPKGGIALLLGKEKR